MWKINYKRAGTVFKRDFNEYRNLKTFKIMLSVFIIAALVISIQITLSNNKEPLLKLTLYNTLLLLALIPPIVNILLFTTVPLTRDKTNGTMLNLLSTPLTPKELVLGKSFAIFLPGYIIATLSSLIVMLSVNFILIVPTDAFFYLPVSLLLDVFLITPMFCYGLTKFTMELSLIKSPELAISPSYLIGFSLVLGIPICSSIGVLDIPSWNFLLLYFTVTFLLWILVCIFSLLLTKERIVLQ